MADITLRFDLRVAPDADTDHATQYQAALDMCEWADSIGVDRVHLSEHHGDPAGFMSAPLTVAAGVLARTRRIAVTVSAALAPLHDPVRIAEQLATIDCLAPGRLRVVLGAGYRKVEFAMAGVDRAHRGALVEECYEVCQAAWRGTPFEWRGREVLVTPTPSTPGGPALSIGGKSEAAGRRAARLDAPFSPATAEPAVRDAYISECARLGRTPRLEGLGAEPMGPTFIMIADDPDAAWAEVAPLVEYDAATYASWQDDAVHSDWVTTDSDRGQHRLGSDLYLVVTPIECIERIRPLDKLTLHPLMGGIPAATAWEGLRRFEARVLPRL